MNGRERLVPSLSGAYSLITERILGVTNSLFYIDEELY